VAAYQPFNIWPGALIFVALLLYAIRDLPPRKAFWIGYIFGLVFYYTLLYWIAWATFFGMLPVPPILALIPAFFCWIFTRLRQINHLLALVLAPFIWLALEYIRTLSQAAFPWNPLGNCFAAYPEFIQYAEYTGVWGISLWAMIINMIFYSILLNSSSRKRTFYLSGIIIALTVAPYIQGKTVIPSEMGEGDIRLALLQGNIGRETKWAAGELNESFDAYFSMSDSLRNSSTELIVWPETAAPCYLRQHRGYGPLMKLKVRKCGIPILTGAPDYTEIAPKEYIYYNAALYYQPQKEEPEIYRKMKLVPFSERIPFSGRLKSLRDIQLGQADFSAGDSLVLFDLDDKHFGVLICFELVFPDMVRSYLASGADFMITITNDMWFGVTSGPYQHLYAGALRAVENRVGIARCANTGISLFYDVYGRPYNMTKLNEQKTVIGKVALNKYKTYYTRHGDYLARASSMIALTAIMLILFQTIHSKRRMF